MVVFSLCLACAGAILSLFARLPLLLALILLTVCAATLPAVLSYFGFGTSAPLLLTILVAIVALQGGYGLGVVLQALRRAPSTEPVQPSTGRQPEEEIP